MPPDDIIRINLEIPVVFKPVHGLSSGTAKENLTAILNDSEAGDIVGGDFNVNFLEAGTLTELAKILDEKGLKVDISPDSVGSLKAWFKMRSVNSLYSQQLMKNGTPDIFLKDLSFKLVKKTGDEPSIPKSLNDKIAELGSTRKDLIKQIAELKERNHFNDQSVSKLCSNLGVINFHNLEESFGNDHASTYYYDEDSETLCYSINSIQHIDYNFDNHFSDAILLDLKVMGALYTNLDRCVLMEAYKLLEKRDKDEAVVPVNINDLSNEALKAFVALRLKNSTTLTNKNGTITLQEDDISSYFKAILGSQALAEINIRLKKPYVLEDPKLMTSLLSEKNLKAYNDGISKLINAVYQHLDPSRPTVEDQTIALNGNGFPAFTDESGCLITVEQIHEKQLTQMERELKHLQTIYPTAIFSVAVIEGTEQPNKYERISQLVDSINTENR
jgi:hypothetical protein